MSVATKFIAMTSKARVNLTMEAEVIQKAKALGLNISKISENAIIAYIERLEGISDIKKAEYNPNPIVWNHKEDGGRSRDRTCDPRHVKAMSYH